MSLTWVYVELIFEVWSCLCPSCVFERSPIFIKHFLDP